MKNGLVFLALLVMPLTAFSASTIIEAKTPFAGSILYVPNDGSPHPAILLLHGSEGGSEPYNRLTAQFFAANGYAALAYCYFDCNRGLFAPEKTLTGVEVQKVFDALAWLKGSPYTQNRKTAVYGVSRGAELSMIVAEKSGEGSEAVIPDAILAHSPSDKCNQAINWVWQDPRCWSCLDPSDCSPQTSLDKLNWNPFCGEDPRNGPDHKPMWVSLPAWQWKGKPLPIGQRIEVEKYSGPIFLSVGTKDQTWPYEQTQRIEKTLASHGRAVEAHYFEGEDHVFMIDASNREHEMMLQFLAKALK